MADFVGFAGTLVVLAVAALIGAYHGYQSLDNRRCIRLAVVGIALLLSGAGVGWLGWERPFYGFHPDQPGGKSGLNCAVSWTGDPTCTRVEAPKPK
jgi:hypothetical protein